MGAATVTTLSTRKPDSVYSVQQWEQLHADVFGTVEVNGEMYEPGEALTRVKDFADYNSLAPVAVAVLAVMQVCASVPAGTTFNAGLGPGSLNQLTAVVGQPGSGKDRHSYRTSLALKVFHGSHEVKPQRLPIGTGEGIVEALKGGKPAIFGTSEVGGFNELMKRPGATLRATVLALYSGNAIGFTTKKEASSLPANSYTAGLWVSTQPDKAGALLDGEDDGLAHRFVWVEPINPTLITKAVEIDYSQNITELHPVILPDDIQEVGVRFHRSIVTATVKAGRETLTYGPQGNNDGHRHQTRLKVAAGLALLASRNVVDLGDWYRAGALMDYSDAVRRNCQKHLEGKDVEAQTKRLENQELAQTRVHENRVKRNRVRILEALADPASEEAVKWSPLLQARPYRERDSMSEALQQLIRTGAVTAVPNADGHTDTLHFGNNFKSVCTTEGVSYMS